MNPYIRIMKNALGYELAYESKSGSFVDRNSSLDKLIANRLGALPRDIVDQVSAIGALLNDGKIAIYTVAEGLKYVG